MFCLLEGPHDQRHLGPELHVAHRCQTVPRVLCKYSLTVWPQTKNQKKKNMRQSVKKYLIKNKNTAKEKTKSKLNSTSTDTDTENLSHPPTNTATLTEVWRRAIIMPAGWSTQPRHHHHPHQNQNQYQVPPNRARNQRTNHPRTHPHNIHTMKNTESSKMLAMAMAMAIMMMMLMMLRAESQSMFDLHTKHTHDPFCVLETSIINLWVQCSQALDQI